MSKVNKRSKLAELRALRQSGKKAFDTYQVQDVDDLYEEVDEDRYKKIVRDRLNQDDFVVDDNGEGYADDGREEWDRVPVYESESDGDMPVRGRPSKTGELLCCQRLYEQSKSSHSSAKKQREEDQAKRDANDRDISEYFTKGAAKAQPKAKVCKPSWSST
jgi:DNA polymerase alpha subunit A